MEIIKIANLALAFVLELCALAALGYWGYQAGGSIPTRLGLAIGAPLLAAVIWGAFVAPRAAVPVPGAVHLAIQIAIFGLAAAGLAATGSRALAGAFALIVIINIALAHAWGQSG